jgi:hypothetical protein
MSKELIVDYRRQRGEHDPIHIDRAVVEQAESFKFPWGPHVVKSSRQHLFPLRMLERFGMGPQILKMFYSCTIESILSGCITL